MALSAADKTFTQARGTLRPSKKPSNKGAKVVRTITGARGFGAELPKKRTSRTTSRTVRKRDTEAELREQLKQKEIERKTLALQQRKETALSELGAERGKVAPLFQAQRRQLSKRSQQAARNMADFLASRGATRSGGAISLEAGRQGELTGGLTDIGLAETSRLGDIARQEQLVGTRFGQDVAAIQSGAEATALERELQTFKTQQAQERQDFGQTIGRFGEDFQAEINRIQANVDAGDRSEAFKIPFLQTARQEKITGMQQAEVAQQQASQVAEQEAKDTTYNRALTRFKEVGQILTDEDSQILGIPKGTKSEQLTVTELQGLNKAKASIPTSQRTLTDNYINASSEIQAGKPWNEVVAKYGTSLIASERSALWQEFKQKNPSNNPFSFLLGGQNSGGSTADEILATDD